MSRLTEKEKNKKLRNLDELIAEFIDTEKKYIEYLGIVVHGYMAEFRTETPLVPVPEDLKDVKGSLVFGNIEDIYHWHKGFFLKALEKNRHSPSDLGKAILSVSREFHMYGRYANTKAMSDYIVNEHTDYFNTVRKKLDDKLTLPDYLIKPIQRLPLIELLVTNITANLRQLDADWKIMHEALLVLQEVLKSVNTFTALQGITNYEGDISDQGTLIFHGLLGCKYDGKKRNHYVFLFKRTLIFTDRKAAKKQYNLPSYTFRNEVAMNKIQLKVLSNERFLLKSCYPNCDSLHIVCYGETEELHQKWLENIKQQLRIQEDLVCDLVNPSRSDENDVLIH